MYVKNSIGVLKKVLMCRPTYLKPMPINEISMKWVDTNLNVEQLENEHKKLVKAYKDNGVEVVFLDADPRNIDSVFARDFGACIKEGYILGSFKEPIRKLESLAYKKKMEELGIPIIAECKNGIFEGGDFVLIDEKTIAIGMLARTNLAGITEIKKQIEKYGYKVVIVPCNEKYLHLDLCFNMVDKNLALAYTDELPQEFLKLLEEKNIDIISIPEGSVLELGGNIQSIGNKRVISLKKNTYINKELRKRGIKVIEVDITEIVKCGGGPHCMTFPLERI